MSNVVGQPITFSRSKKTAMNRIMKSAMTERVCTWDDENPDNCGKPTDAYNRIYELWGKGGIGIIVLGNIPCDRRYPEARRNAVIDPLSSWDPVAAFKPAIQAAKAHGSLVIGQLTHAGRQTSDTITNEPVSSSDVQGAPLGGMTFAKPRALTIPEVEDIVQRFAFAAGVLHDAGADGIQLHAAHGYLISQFLSPRVNKRTDKYGPATLETRSRFVFEIVEAIKARVNDESFIISLKINSADFAEGGFDENDSRELAIRLEAAGVDLIELSGGTYESMDGVFSHKKESTKKREAFFIEFADRIRPHLKSAKLAVTGGFRSVDGMAKAISEGSCDFAGVARPLTAEFNFANDIVNGVTARAKPNYIFEAIQTAGSYLQLVEIGDGRPAPDFSDLEVAKSVEAAIMKDAVGAFLYRPEWAATSTTATAAA